MDSASEIAINNNLPKEYPQVKSSWQRYLHSLTTRPDYLPDGFIRRITIPIFLLYGLGLVVNILHGQWHYVGPIAGILLLTVIAYRNGQNPRNYWQLMLAMVLLPTLIALSMWSEMPMVAMAWGVALPIFYYAALHYQRAAEFLVLLIIVLAFFAKPHLGQLGTIRYVFWLILVTICLYNFTHSISLRYQEMLRLSTTDDLTQLLNRRALDERLREWGLTKLRNPEVPVTLAILDIDLFKAINDKYGHPVGDAVLKHFSDVLGRRVRANDIVARQGGEEFAILFPYADMAEARSVVADIRQLLQDLSGPQGLRIGFSAGLAELHPNEAVDDWWLRADKALYQAKADGRNCDRLA